MEIKANYEASSVGAIILIFKGWIGCTHALNHKLIFDAGGYGKAHRNVPPWNMFEQF